MTSAAIVISALSSVRDGCAASTTLDGTILLFPIHRAELRASKSEGEGLDAADFAPRWWPAPEADLD